MKFVNCHSKCLILLIFTCYSQLVFSQSLFSGNIVDSTGNSIPRALVSSLEIDSTIISYTFSDESGYWRLPYAKDAFLIKVKYLGFQDKYMAIGKDTLFPDIILLEELRWLDHVLVSKERLGVESSGDTIRYDLEAFNTGFERNLGDVIENLPGLSVSEEGDIEFNGKRVDLLFLEGLDLLGQQHQIATDNIHANYIDGIEILKNYKTAEYRNSQKKSDQVALNVDLTDEAIEKWIGNIRAGGGYEKVGEIDLAALKIGGKLSATSFIKGNNTGNPLLSFMDYLSLQTSPRQTLKGANGNLEELLPAQFRVAEDLQENLDGLIASNMVIKNDEDVNLKASFLTNLSDRKRGNEFTRTYWGSSDLYTSNERINTTSSLFNLNIQPSWRLWDKTRIKFNLPLHYENLNDRLLQDGFLNESPVLAGKESRNRKILTNPSIQMTNAFSNRWFLTTSAEYHRDIKTPFSLIFSDSNNRRTWLTGQEINIDNEAYAVSLSVEFDSDNLGIFSVEGRLAEESYHGTSTSRSASEDFQWEYLADQRTSSLKFSYELDTMGWFFNPDMEMVHLNIATSNAEYSDILINYDILLYHKFRDLHQLSFSFQNKKSPQSLNAYNTSLKIKDLVTLEQSTLLPDQLTRSIRGQIHYLNYDFKSGWRILQELNYTSTKNGVYQQPVFLDSVFVHVNSLQNSERSISLISQISRPILTNSIFLNCDFGYTKSFVETIDNSNSEFDLMHLFLGFKYSVNKKLSIHPKIGRRFLGSSNEENVISRSFLSDNISIDFKSQIGDWVLESKTSYHINRIGEIERTSFLKLDLINEWILNKQVSLFISAVDLLNLNGVLNVSANYNPSYLQNSTYLRFPGYILLGGNFTF